MSAVAPSMASPGGQMMGHEMDMNKQDTQFFGYEASQDVGGFVTLQIPPGKKLEHLGIKVQFIGRIDMVRTRRPKFPLRNCPI